MSYLIEAFKALNALDEDVFSVSDDGIEKLSAFEDDDTVSDDITIYDVDAENESELEDSYIGKIILDCNVCHSKLYKDKADVVIDEEQQVANIDEECPYCYSTDGFKVIGEVAPMNIKTEEPSSNNRIKESVSLSKKLKKGTIFSLVKDWVYDTYENFLDEVGNTREDAGAFLKEYPELRSGNKIVFPKGTTFEITSIVNGLGSIKSDSYNQEFPLRIDFFVNDSKSGIFDFDEKTLSDEPLKEDVKSVENDVLSVGTRFTTLKDWFYDTYSNFIDEFGQSREQASIFLEDNPELLSGNKIVFPAGSSFEVVWKNSISATIKSLNYNVELPLNLSDFKHANQEGVFDIDNNKSMRESTNIPFQSVKTGTTFKLAKDWKYDLLDNFYTYDHWENKDQAKDFLKKHPNLVKGRWVVFPKGTVFRITWVGGISASVQVKDFNVELPLSLDDFDNEVKSGIFDFEDNTLYEDIQTQEFSTGENFVDDSIVGVPSHNDSFTEAIDLASKEDTIAGVLADHMKEFYADTDPNKLRQHVLQIVKDSPIADKDIVKKFERDLFSKKSLGALLSTIATYMTGTKVAKVGRKNEAVEDTLKESAEDNLGTDLEKYQKWVDYDMKKYHKISNKTNSEIRKAGLQIVKDKYGAYQVTAGQYDESLKECVKDVTITTDDSRTTMTSEDDGKVTVTTEPVENHDEEAEVLAPVSDETEMEIEENSADDMDAEIDDIDSDSFEESLSSVLKEQYDNVKSYTMSSCAFGNNDVVTVNGIIEFASGKKGNAQIKLESHTIDKKGNTTFLTESSKLFSTRYLVSGNLKEKKFITESIRSKEDK